MKREIMINDKKIGPGHPTYIVAEMSANHNRDFDKATAILQAAKDAGADAVKLQTYTPDTLTIDCDKDYFRVGKGSIWEGRTLYDLYKDAYTPWDWQPKLMDLATKLDLDLFSTPFDPSAVDFLEEMGVPAYKVASFEIVDIPLLRKIADTGKPVILSTGMASIGEIEEAVATLREKGSTDIVLLKCTSAYPSPPEEMNLHTIRHLSETFSLPAGLSDHTLGSAVSIAGVALGASVIEKHFTLTRSDPGPDSSFSMEPHEFREMVESIRIVEKAMGKISYEVTEKQEASKVFRRSLFVVQDMKAGEEYTYDNVRSIRPAKGLHTRYLDEVIGRRASREIERGTPLEWNLIC